MCSRMHTSTYVCMIAQQAGVTCIVLVVSRLEFVTCVCVCEYSASHGSHSVWTLRYRIWCSPTWQPPTFWFPASRSSNNSQGIVELREWWCLYFRPVLSLVEFKMMVQFLFTVIYLFLVFCILCVSLTFYTTYMKLCSIILLKLCDLVVGQEDGERWPSVWIHA
jgi:hypothetical protein